MLVVKVASLYRRIIWKSYLLRPAGSMASSKLRRLRNHQQCSSTSCGIQTRLPLQPLTQQPQAASVFLRRVSRQAREVRMLKPSGLGSSFTCAAHRHPVKDLLRLEL